LLQAQDYQRNFLLKFWTGTMLHCWQCFKNIVTEYAQELGSPLVYTVEKGRKIQFNNSKLSLTIQN
jgi:hypothetical protein